MKKLRVGLIGCGAMHANSSHLPQLCRLEGASLAALCDLNEESLHTAMEKYGVSQGFSDFRRMLEEVDLDAVFVIIRPSRLKDVVIPCFEKGLAVSVEKSPGTNASETEAMAEAAARNGCLNMVGFNRRFSPVVTKAREMLRAGTGPLRIVGNFYRTYADSIETEHAGIHGLDMMRCLGGEVKKVVAKARTRPGGERDSLSVILEYENGSMGSYLEKHYCGETRECYEMHGDGVSVSIDYQKALLRAFTAEDKQMKEMSDRDITGRSDPVELSSSFWETKHFVDSVSANRCPFPDLKDSLKTMKLNELIFGNL